MLSYRDIFNLGKIDINWIEIEKKALKSNIFLACKLWEENKSYTQLTQTSFEVCSPKPFSLNIFMKPFNNFGLPKNHFRFLL